MSQTRDPHIGTEVAAYRIEEVVGAGGMGIVYRALDPRLDRHVALKLLPSELAQNGEYRARFLRESRQAAAIEHPSIVPVHDAGDANGVLYIAMRYIDGSDLGRTIAREGPLAPDRAVSVLAEIADALDAAHARGLVHRDVKPSNVLLSSPDAGGRERAYLTDFGISKLVAGEAALTATGHVLGTAEYVAPELVEGGEVDSRADVYSLGCVLFECLAGEPPFVRETPVSVLWAHVNDVPPPLSERRRELPTAIDDVVARSLAKTPDDRFPSCAEVIQAAREALGVVQAEGAPTSATAHSRALDDHCLEVLKAALRGRLVVVVGSGADLASMSEAAALPPSDSELATGLVGAFGYPGSHGLELPRVSQYVSVMHGSGPLGDELHDLLTADFAPGAAHRLLARLPAMVRAAGAVFPVLVSIAYDATSERAFADAEEALDVVSYIAGGAESGRFRHVRPDGTETVVDVPNTYTEGLSGNERTVLLRLHGGFDPSRDRESFLVTEDDHIDYLLRSDVAGARPGRGGSEAAAQPRPVPGLLAHGLVPARAPVRDLARRRARIPVVGRLPEAEPDRPRVLAPPGSGSDRRSATGVRRLHGAPPDRSHRTGAGAVTVAPPEYALVRPASPYRGLAPFEETELDALLFFGREREREVVTANLIASRLTVLYGPSGVGKSSLLRAGVAHALNSGARRNLELHGAPEAAAVVVANWVNEPLRTILDAVEETVAELRGDVPETSSLPFVDALSRYAGALDGDLYVILDQMEEYFLYHGAEGGPLAEQLPRLLRASETHVNVLLALREDALSRLDAFAAGVPGILRNRLQLEHLDRTAARAAIVEPLERWNALGDGDHVELEPALVDAVLAQVAASRGDVGGNGGAQLAAADQGRIEAPYLQLVMERLWSEERSAGSTMLRKETLDRLGGAARIVESHFERAIDELPPESRELAASAFAHLVTASGMKIAHTTDDLAAYAHSSEGAMLGVLESLTRQRILRAEQGEGAGQTRFEVFHDVLAAPVLSWRRSFEEERRLEAERAALRKRHRRLLMLAVVSLVGLALALGLAVFALTQRSEARSQAEQARANAAQAEENAARATAASQRAEEQAQAAQEQARIAHARQLAANALSALTTDPELGLLLGIEAAGREQSPESEEVLREALLASRVRLVLRTDGPVHAAEYSPDGSRIAVASEDGRARIFAADSGRLLATLVHKGPVLDARFSPDGKLVATASADGTARLWRGRSGDSVRVLDHGGRVAAVEFSADGGVLVSGGGHTARVWDVGSGELLRTLDHPAAVTMVAVSPVSDLMATAADDDVVRIFGVSSGQLVGTVEHTARVTSVSFSTDAALMVTTSNDRTTRLHNVGSGDEQVLPGPRGPFFDAEFSSDGALLVTGSSDGLARVWSVRNGRRLVLMTGHVNYVGTASFSPDRTWVVTGSPDRTARTWQTATGKGIAVLAGHTESVTSVAFSPDGAWVLTASEDGTARVWDPGTNTELVPLGSHGSPVLNAVFSPDGSLAASAGEDGTARIFQVDGNAPPLLLRHGAPVTTVAFDGTGRRLLTASADGTARLWRTRDGDLIRTFRCSGPCETAALDPDGELVAAAGPRGVVELWRAGDGTSAGALEAGTAVATVAFSPDGKLLVSATRDGAQLWSIPDGRLVHTLDGHRGAVVSAEFSPDGKLVLTAGNDKTARLWDATTGESIRTLQGHEKALTSATFRRDGAQVVSTSWDHDGRVWDVETGESRVLRGHFALVTDAAFSPDGRWILTAGPTTAGLWNARTGKLLYLRGHRRLLTSVSFDANGERILTSSRDGTVRHFVCEICGSSDQLVARAEARLARTGRELTPAERARFLER